MSGPRLALQVPSRHISVMPRTDLTWRVVRQDSAEARDAHLGTTGAERLTMVAQLSRLAWIASGRPFPHYDRATMPVRISTLHDQGTTAD